MMKLLEQLIFKETLSVMLSSAFASANVKNEVERVEKSEISLLKKVGSFCYVEKIFESL